MTLNKPSGWEDWINTVQLGDCLKLMKEMPEGVVHTTVTSIPYYGLRDYGIAPTKWPAVDYTPMPGLPAIHIPEMECCYGLEPTPEAYVGHGVLVFREVKRIMHPTGCLWLNMGDSYWGGKGQSSQAWSTEHTDRGVIQAEQHQICGKGETRPTDMKHDSLKPKDLLEMPSRLALALQADGWWLRCRIPWLKRNAMPESVQGSRWERHRIKIRIGKRGTQPWSAETGQSDRVGGKPIDPTEWRDCPGCPKCDPNDGLVLRMSAGRPTQAVEYVFLLQKSPECYYDGEAVRVPHTRDWQNETMGGALKPGSVYTLDSKTPTAHKRQEKKPQMHPSGRSRRNSDWWFESWQGLWTDENGEPLAFIVNPKPYKRAHFATFSPSLVIPCIRAGASERGCCPECGSPWVRVVRTKSYITRPTIGRETQKAKQKPEYSAGLARTGGHVAVDTKTLGWRATCDCGKEPVPCLAFDPFAGTGTVIEVARKMGRSSLGFEISEEYVKDFCKERLAQGVLGLTPE